MSESLEVGLGAGVMGLGIWSFSVGYILGGIFFTLCGMLLMWFAIYARK